MLSQHPLGSWVERPISRTDAARCPASEAEISSSVTLFRAGTRPALAVHEQLPLTPVEDQPYILILTHFAF